MRCNACGCIYNKNNSCTCTSSVTLDSRHRCEHYTTVKSKRGYPYTSVIEVFNDFYYGKGIKHNSVPNTSFCYGDIVTTECGWDLGFHSVVSDRVYGRPVFYLYSNSKPVFGGHNDWYKTGVNVTWEEWESICREFRTI